jgi:hypothetical protein
VCKLGKITLMGVSVQRSTYTPVMVTLAQALSVT